MKTQKRDPRRPALIRTNDGKPIWYLDGPRAFRRTNTQHSAEPTQAARKMCHHKRPRLTRDAPALYVVGENEIENYSKDRIVQRDHPSTTPPHHPWPGHSPGTGRNSTHSTGVFRVGSAPSLCSSRPCPWSSPSPQSAPAAQSA
jgi:hypothetical protein